MPSRILLKTCALTHPPEDASHPKRAALGCSPSGSQVSIQSHPTHTRNPKFSPHSTLLEGPRSSLHAPPTPQFYSFLILRAPGKQVYQKEGGTRKVRGQDGRTRMTPTLSGASSPPGSQVSSGAASLQTRLALFAVELHWEECEFG